LTVKTAISIPDDLFRLAETAARQLRVSRSELYARAIAQFLKQHDEDAITERLNAIYSRRAAKMNPGLDRAQLKSLKKELW
jgi:metal-responsive CopG/Arc/MetJ family transcriptional regulator